MGRRTLWAAIAAWCGVLALVPAAAAPAREHPLADVRSFAFAAGNGTLRGDLTTRYAAYDLVVIDGDDATAAQVAQIRASGPRVLAYLSIGSVERWRTWAPRALPAPPAGIPSRRG